MPFEIGTFSISYELSRDGRAANPFVLYDAASMLTDDLTDLIGARFRGDNPLLQLFDEALRDRVMRAPQ